MYIYIRTYQHIVFVSFWLTGWCLNQNQIPSNFYGSPEVYSGYLSNSDVFIDAFTLQDDHVSISGSIPEVERALATWKNTGIKKYNM